MEDFRRQFVKDHFPELSRKDQVEVLKTLPPEDRLAGLTDEQILECLARRSAKPTAPARKPRRKK
jgi:hypothetical protein